MPFIEDMQEAYQAADVVLCRAGATTLAEISWIGLPAILVPYPYATGGHQELNARIFMEAGAAQMILDRDLTGERVSSVLLELLAYPRTRGEMSARCKAMGRPRAAADIVDAMGELLHNRGGHDASK
jgi:UDP-N-acetylglucosamine--N-acetylmuramyl-(pentapeptide) pyrophosphoryl-undecaprenol N-acetylglucosamine transferase